VAVEVAEVVVVEPALASVPVVAEEEVGVAEVVAVAARASENTLGHRKSKRQ
jgi:BMFP domain-containing protein YqiC